MISAFGVEHGESVEKGLNPVKGLKAMGAKRATKQFERGKTAGFQQQSSAAAGGGGGLGGLKGMLGGQSKHYQSGFGQGQQLHRNTRTGF